MKLVTLYDCVHRTQGYFSDETKNQFSRRSLMFLRRVCKLAVVVPMPKYPSYNRADPDCLGDVYLNIENKAGDLRMEIYFGEPHSNSDYARAYWRVSHGPNFNNGQNHWLSDRTSEKDLAKIIVSCFPDPRTEPYPGAKRVRKPKPQKPKDNIGYDGKKQIPVGDCCGYAGITHDKELIFEVPSAKHGERSFRVALYNAYNAHGLIGSEHNGIVILDQNRFCVVLDRHCEQASGYNGPSRKQVEEWERIIKMSWEDFKIFVNTNSRTREYLS